MVSGCDARINASNALIIARYAHIVDVLQEHLARARASGGVFARSVARSPWGLRLPALSSSRSTPSYGVVRGCGSTIRDRRSSSRPVTSRSSAAGPITMSPTAPQLCVSPESSSEHATRTTSIHTMSTRPCSCVGRIGSPGTLVAACSRRFRRFCICLLRKTTRSTTSSGCSHANWRGRSQGSRQCWTGCSTSSW
jgi:hypothetical protein